MKLNNLVKNKIGMKKRIGRGIGSGLGKTAGRGTKGQKARGSVPVGFTGAGLPLYKKLPLKRGLGNTVLAKKLRPVNLSSLNVLKEKTVVDTESLLNANIINKKDLQKGVKILGHGELKLALTVKLPVSKSAREKIEKIGGEVADV